MSHIDVQKVLAKVVVISLFVLCNFSLNSTDFGSDILDEYAQETYANITRSVNPGSGEGSREIIVKIGNELDIMSSKVDEIFVDFSETWTILDELNTNITQFSSGFKETWTILGDTTDVYVSDIDVLESTLNTYTLSVIGWLKTLYAMQRGWTA